MKFIWVVLVNVKPLKEAGAILGGATGAYVNVLALAKDVSGCRLLVNESLRESGFEVISIDIPEKLEACISRGPSNMIEITELSKNLNARCLVEYDEFQAYD